MSHSFRSWFQNLSVKAKISLGFTVVLLLHVSIAILGHYGLEESGHKLTRFDALNHQDRELAEFQREIDELTRRTLLFTQTGQESHASRAFALYDDLDRLVSSKETVPGSETESLVNAMGEYLRRQRELFEAIVSDRSRRTLLVESELLPAAHEAIESVDRLHSEGHQGAEQRSTERLLTLRNDLVSAETAMLRYLRSPDSQHVREAQRLLADARDRVPEGLGFEGESARLRELIEAYETSFLQMVQVTRGYLHLVNVVMAGEAAEFDRVVIEFRDKNWEQTSALAQEMLAESSEFQAISSLVSLATIMLGLLAAGWIGKQIVPPLNAVTDAFDGIAAGDEISSIPGLERRDDIGRLARAAQSFRSQIDAALEQARSASVAKGDFLANMSHEIRTPMTAILGYLELLQHREVRTDHERADESIQTIRRNADHLMEIIDDILDVSKIEAGRFSVELISVNPVDELRRVTGLMHERAMEAGLALKVRFETPVPESILCDPTRLRQILLNLTGNALKFTHEGAVRIAVSCDPESESMDFAITDTGIGMSEQQLAVIREFDAFSQADSSTARQYGGTGLGLRISNELAQLLGGDIRVQSTQGAGSTFRVRIGTGSLRGVRMIEPGEIEADQGGAIADHVSQDSVRLDGVRIMLVEDGKDNQRLIAFHLRKAGSDVEIVENGREAIDHLRERDRCPDLVLMDMQMPELDGYAATAELRRRGFTVPIIALTAHAMPTDRQRCLDAGCDDYLTKPLNRDDLIECCAAWRRRAQDAEAA